MNAQGWRLEAERSELKCLIPLLPQTSNGQRPCIKPWTSELWNPEPHLYIEPSIGQRCRDVKRTMARAYGNLADRA